MSDPTPPADKPDVPAEDQVSAAPDGEELPPLPDGGLSGALPAWLQQAPSRPARTRAPETVDLSSLTDGVEIPDWLSDLSRRVDAGSAAHPKPQAERPLAEAIIKDAPEVGEPEAALEEPALDVETEEAVAEDRPPRSEPAPGSPEPRLRFQVRNATRTVPDPLDAGPDGGTQNVSPVMRYQMRAPAPQSPRSIGATVLLVLLLIALAAVGVWYYWM